MQHLRSIATHQLDHSWVTIGSFDGVHLGHQELLNRLSQEAHVAGAKAVVITFYPHPVEVLRGSQSPIYLSDPEERARLISQQGIDVVITLEFTRELAGLSAMQFMAMLKDSIGIERLWAGYDFALGKGREGTIGRLREIGLELNYSVHVVDPVKVNGEVISSSIIRSFVGDGFVEKAAARLGRWYSIEGTVIHGDARGKSLGFPTANIDFSSKRIIPGPGIYAGWAWYNDQMFQAVTNVGYRPTFVDHASSARVEVYILDFDQNLYGETIKFEFVSRLRDELRFSSIQDLVNQIHSDIFETRKLLQNGRRTPDLLTRSP